MPVPIAVAPMLISRISSAASVEALLVLGEHHRVGAELLAQRHGHGVLQLGAPHLQHVARTPRPSLRSRTQEAHRVHQPDDAQQAAIFSAVG